MEPVPEPASWKAEASSSAGADDVSGDVVALRCSAGGWHSTRTAAHKVRYKNIFLSGVTLRKSGVNKNRAQVCRFVAARGLPT
jgi:hypothetical protein